MKILLLQEDEQIRERVAFALEGQFNAIVQQVSTLDDARRFLKEHSPEIGLMVFDFDNPKEVDQLRAEYSQIQSIVFMNPQSSKPLVVSAPPGKPIPIFINRGDIIRNLTSTIGAMIKQSMLPNSDDDRNFCKIRTKLLLSVCPLESDVYIRLSEAKYVKLMQPGDTFDLQDMEKYTIKKGVDFLYIRKNAIQDFIKKYQDELNSYLERKPEMSLEEVADLNDQVLETVQELASTVGFNEDVQKIAKSQVQMVVKSMGKSPRLSKLFGKLESFRGKYIASHSTMCGYLACSIATQMQWGSETTFHKLTLAAFLHDITLSNHDLARCETVAEANQGAFSEEEKKAFAKHTMAGAEIARQFTEVPPDVDIIIAQHHERADGTGFPRGLGAAYIAPLAAIFIVAHDMTRFAIEKGFDFDVTEFLEIAKERYKPSAFRKVVQAIEQLAGG